MNPKTNPTVITGTHKMFHWHSVPLPEDLSQPQKCDVIQAVFMSNMPGPLQ